MVSCAPGRSGDIVNVDVYCDSCHVKVTNSDKNNFIETVYNGDVSGYKRIVVERFISEYSCVRAVEFTNYDTTSTVIYYIESADTLATEVDGISGYCN